MLRCNSVPESVVVFRAPQILSARTLLICSLTSRFGYAFASTMPLQSLKSPPSRRMVHLPEREALPLEQMRRLPDDQRKVGRGCAGVKTDAAEQVAAVDAQGDGRAGRHLPRTAELDIFVKFTAVDRHLGALLDIAGTCVAAAHALPGASVDGQSAAREAGRLIEARHDAGVSQTGFAAGDRVPEMHIVPAAVNRDVVAGGSGTFGVVEADVCKVHVAVQRQIAAHPERVSAAVDRDAGAVLGERKRRSQRNVTRKPDGAAGRGQGQNRAFKLGRGGDGDNVRRRGEQRAEDADKCKDGKGRKNSSDLFHGFSLNFRLRLIYSTVTLLARLRGLSMSQPRAAATW